ncbi:nitronate monooxygenase [Litorivivens lipolytica]|uniref:Nitronate monooxygenase n=1 Tax=Litorivivens lipolytica TaxID=1524264 RepID=A0A7W4W569_9GAMM|nr:nitronate monooxygenase [Litorivivens lipolytica]MBB3047663.1 nitronate monooxygenase [Litorivivens lipolytica]
MAGASALALSVPGLSAPIVQAPMAGVQGAALAAAVSDAGALGSLPCAMLSGDALEAELKKLTELTSKPVNLNFFCHQPQEESEERYARWLELLSPFFREYGLSVEDLPVGAQREPFSEAVAEVVAPFRPAVVSFHFGLPEPGLLARVKSWGGQVWSSATTLEEAIWLQQNGADAVIVQGLEAGGHRGHFLKNDLEGQLPTRELLARCAAKMSLPLIAAGGIATPADVPAYRQGGAAGVQLGSAYLLAEEATTSPLHRQALSNERRCDTAITNLYTGRPARGIVTRLMSSLGLQHEAAPVFPLAANATGALRSAAEKVGDDTFTPLWCGENAEPRNASAASITREFINGWV